MTVENDTPPNADDIAVDERMDARMGQIFEALGARVDEAADDGPDADEFEPSTGLPADDDADEPAEAAPEAPAAAAPPAAPAVDTAKEAAMAQLHQQLRGWQTELETRAAQYAELEKLRPDVERFRRFQEAVEERDPAAALAEFGIAPDDFAKALVEKRGAAPGAGKRRQEQSEIAALRERIEAMDRAEQSRQAQARAEAERQVAFQAIDLETGKDPLLKAMGETARASVAFWLHDEHARTGEQRSYAEATKAVGARWRELLHTVLKDPQVRSELLGSGQAGQPAKTPTIETAARPEVTKTRTTKPIAEMSRDEAINAAWRRVRANQAHRS